MNRKILILKDKMTRVKLIFGNKYNKEIPDNITLIDSLIDYYNKILKDYYNPEESKFDDFKLKFKEELAKINS